MECHPVIKQKTTYYITLPTQNSRQGKDTVTESSSVIARVHTEENFGRNEMLRILTKTISYVVLYIYQDTQLYTLNEQIFF